MKLVIAVRGEGDEFAHVDHTGLAGEVVFDPESVREEFVIPFASVSNAIDCLRIVIRGLEREAK